MAILLAKARTRRRVTPTSPSVWGIEDVDAKRPSASCRVRDGSRFASDPSLRLRVTLVMLDKDADISRTRFSSANLPRYG
jgi:hypothetical protein